jgi:hypothetical protein
VIKKLTLNLATVVGIFSGAWAVIGILLEDTSDSMTLLARTDADSFHDRRNG